LVQEHILNAVSIADTPPLMTREAQSISSGEVLQLPLSTLLVASIVSASMWWGIITLTRLVLRVL